MAALARQPIQPPQQPQMAPTPQHAQMGDPKLAEALSTIDLLQGEQVYRSRATATSWARTRPRRRWPRKNLVIKRLGDDEIRRFLTNLSSVIVAHSSRAGV